MDQIEQIKKELAQGPNVRPTREQVLMLIEYVEAAESDTDIRFRYSERVQVARKNLGLE